jgi:dihydroneopterin aldolase
LAVQADIGFHDFEVGAPQRLLVTVEVWLDEAGLPAEDHPAEAWNYDFLRTQVKELAAARRYNLQETLAHAIFERVAAFHGVRALRVRLSKPDVYADAEGVGVEVASFQGLWPEP